MRPMLRVAPLLLALALTACQKKSEPAPSGAPAGSGSAATEAGLSQQDVKAVVRANRPSMEKCYDEALSAKPDFKGKITLVFSVNPDGTVDKKRAGLGGDLGGETFAKCVLDVVVAMHFPAAKAPTDVQMPVYLSKRADAGVAAVPDARAD
jgi:hypothetical protein